MNFINKVTKSIEKISEGVAHIKSGDKHANKSPAPHVQQQQQQPESRAPFEGPFLKFNGTDLAANVNKYSVLVIVKPGSTETPCLKVSSVKQMSAPLLLDQYADHRFWRIQFNVPLKSTAQAVQYSVNCSNDFTFHVPGLQDPYRWFFTSCNGFSSDVSEERLNELNNIWPLWRDILRDHRAEPYHAQVGGGDQVYMDNVWLAQSLKDWIENPNKEHKRTAPFTEEMNREAHRFYWQTYMKHFKEEGFAEAIATIPYFFTWDDHDIFDGYGSYPEYLGLSPVIQNLFVAAQRFYLLFQQHTNLAHARQDGFIGVHGHSSVLQYGPHMAVVAADVRTERTLAQIVSADSWKLIQEAIDRLAPTTRHVVWGATIPLVWPRILGENAVSIAGTAVNKLTSAIDGISNMVNGTEANDDRSALVKMFQKSTVYTNVLNSLGEPELLDDLNDHWTAENHEAERLLVLEWFQQFAHRRGNCRITFLSGDVHCCGVGKLHSSDTALQNDEKKDHRLMYQIVSSAVGNVPPPEAVILTLNKSSREIELDEHTKEVMCPVFQTGVDDQPLNNQFVYGARNWCRVTSPASNPNSLFFEIMVEKVLGDPKGETKPYGVSVPGLAV